MAVFRLQPVVNIMKGNSSVSALSALKTNCLIYVAEPELAWQRLVVVQGRQQGLLFTQAISKGKKKVGLTGLDHRSALPRILPLAGIGRRCVGKV